MLLTCDWSRSEVFSHRLPKNGPTFDAQQLRSPSDALRLASGRALALRAQQPLESRRADALPLAEGTETPKDAWRQPDPDRVIAHLAVKALVDLNSIDECIAVLKRMHNPKTVDGLFKVLSTSRDEALHPEIWTTLIRLYHREGEFTVDSPKWLGTRPDTTGPYYDRQKWSESDRIQLTSANATNEPN